MGPGAGLHDPCEFLPTQDILWCGVISCHCRSAVPLTPFVPPRPVAVPAGLFPERCPCLPAAVQLSCGRPLRRGRAAGALVGRCHSPAAPAGIGSSPCRAPTPSGRAPRRLRRRGRGTTRCPAGRVHCRGSQEGRGEGISRVSPPAALRGRMAATSRRIASAISAERRGGAGGRRAGVSSFARPPCEARRGDAAPGQG